jgi:TonB family protein
MAVLAWAATLQAPTPSSSPSPPLRIGGTIEAPKKVKHVVPTFPAEALRAGLSGVVVLECTIDTQGRVAGTRVLSGVPPLSESAVNAVEKWRYRPTRLNGAPVPVIMTATVNFKRDFHLHLSELIDSLKSKNEFIRESAVKWLAGTRPGPKISGGDWLAILQDLRRLSEHDESERVRAAAVEALTQLEAR